MSDATGPGGMTTNGSHNGNPAVQSSVSTASFDSKSVDQRLEALMETIHTWDWRAASQSTTPDATDDPALTAPAHAVNAEPRQRDGSGQPDKDPSFSVDLLDAAHVEPTAVPGSHVEPASAPTPDSERSEPSVFVPPVIVAPPETPTDIRTDPPTTVVPLVSAVTPDQPEAVDATATTPATAATAAVMIEQVPGAITIDPPLTAAAPDAAVPPFSPESEPPPRVENRRGPIGRLWANRRTRTVAILCVVAVVAVVLIIWATRSTHNDASSSGSGLQQSPTTTAVTSARSTPTAFVAPISRAELAQYQGYAAMLQSANKTATNEFKQASNTSAAAQLGSSVTAYRSALNLYGFQLHFIQWPPSMQDAVANDQTQIAALMSSLQSFSTVTAAGTSAWLSDFHAQARALQSADNQLRRDLGLPSLSDFP